LAKGPRRTCWLVRSGSPARSANSTTRTRERCPDHGHAPCAGVHRRALKIVERAPASPLGWGRVAGGDRYHFCVWRGRLGAGGQSGDRNNTDRVVENDPSRDMRSSELLRRKIDHRALISPVSFSCCNRRNCKPTLMWSQAGGANATARFHQNDCRFSGSVAARSSRAAGGPGKGLVGPTSIRVTKLGKRTKSVIYAALGLPPPGTACAARLARSTGCAASVQPSVAR
jgi:hypothetical protein